MAVISHNVHTHTHMHIHTVIQLLVLCRTFDHILTSEVQQTPLSISSVQVASRCPSTLFCFFFNKIGTLYLYTQNTIPKYYNLILFSPSPIHLVDETSGITSLAILRLCMYVSWLTRCVMPCKQNCFLGGCMPYS